MKKWIVIAVMVILIGSLLVWRFVFPASQRSSEEVQTVPVRRGDLEVTVTASGYVRAASQVDLAFQVSGQVAEILVEEGQVVKAGQPLVRLDLKSLELQVAQAEANLTAAEAQLQKLLKGPSEAELEAARAAVRSAQAAYEAAKAQVAMQNKDLRLAEINLEKAKSALEQAQAAYDRVAHMPNVAMLPQSLQLQQATLDYEAAKLNYEKVLASLNDTALQSAYAQLAQARAQLESLENTPSEEDIEISRAQVRQAEVALEQAKLNLERATLKAPFDGFVESINVEIGQTVSAGLPAVTLVNLSSLEVKADLVEVDVAKVKEGQEVRITFDALPARTYRGVVKRIGRVGSVVQGVVLFPVMVSIENPDDDIRVGMTANLDIVVGKAENALLVPASAIRSMKGKQVVLVKRGDSIKPVPVKVGLSNETTSEIVEGDIREGDEVVVGSLTSTQQREGRGMFFGMPRPPRR